MSIVYEDAHLRIIDKPVGMVVHPAPGHWSGTLMNGLLGLDPQLMDLPRAGIVHRLDKDTSGLIDHIYLYSKVVEGSYPNYQQVIPKETHQRIKLERELLLQCVHRAALVCSEKANSIKMKLSSNLLELTAQSPDFGEAHESMAISYSGPELQVAFNPAFLIDPLRALTKDEVFFEVKDEVSPGVFKTLENFVCVIMPVRLS